MPPFRYRAARGDDAGRDSAAAPLVAQAPPSLSTFSIVDCDPTDGVLRVAVQWRVVGAGSIVPAAEAGVRVAPFQSNAPGTS